MSERPLSTYLAWISVALSAGDVKAVPALLVLMASDGYGHEAETIRRTMLAARAADA